MHAAEKTRGSRSKGLDRPPLIRLICRAGRQNAPCHEKPGVKEWRRGRRRFQAPGGRPERGCEVWQRDEACDARLSRPPLTWRSAAAKAIINQAWRAPARLITVAQHAFLRTEISPGTAWTWSRGARARRVVSSGVPCWPLTPVPAAEAGPGPGKRVSLLRVRGVRAWALRGSRSLHDRAAEQQAALGSRGDQGRLKVPYSTAASDAASWPYRHDDPSAPASSLPSCRPPRRGLLAGRRRRPWAQDRRPTQPLSTPPTRAPGLRGRRRGGGMACTSAPNSREWP